jgi:hypothetical protein
MEMDMEMEGLAHVRAQTRGPTAHVATYAMSYVAVSASGIPQGLWITHTLDALSAHPCRGKPRRPIHEISKQ